VRKYVVTDLEWLEEWVNFGCLSKKLECLRKWLNFEWCLSDWQEWLNFEWLSGWCNWKSKFQWMRVTELWLSDWTLYGWEWLKQWLNQFPIYPVRSFIFRHVFFPCVEECCTFCCSVCLYGTMATAMMSISTFYCPETLTFPFKKFIKVKFTLAQATKGKTGSIGIAPLFL
jgi:hypothetical protein